MRTRLVEKVPVISHSEALGFEKFEQNIEVPNSRLKFVARSFSHRLSYQNKKFTIFTASGNVQIKKEVKSLEYFSILLTSVNSSIRKIFLTSSQNANLQFNPEEVNYLNGFFHIRRILFSVKIETSLR